MLSLPGMLGTGFPDREMMGAAAPKGLSPDATCVTLSWEGVAVYILWAVFCNRFETDRGPRRTDPAGASLRWVRR